MKHIRQKTILEIIKEESIETQEDLTDKLQERGITSTQATISRDIKELGLIKVMDENGVYIYAAADSLTANAMHRYKQIFANSVLTITSAAGGGFIVIKTLSSSAGVVSEAIDSFKFPEIAGTIAGDNTVFIALRDVKSSTSLIKQLYSLVNTE